MHLSFKNALDSVISYTAILKMLQNPVVLLQMTRISGHFI